MISQVEQNLVAIRALCEEFGVLRLELFGSAATGAFEPERSDLYFLVEYPPDYDFGSWATRYVDLQPRLEPLFGCSVASRMAGAPRSSYVMKSINESRRLLYTAA